MDLVLARAEARRARAILDHAIENPDKAVVIDLDIFARLTAAFEKAVDNEHQRTSEMLAELDELTEDDDADDMDANDPEQCSNWDDNDLQYCNACKNYFRGPSTATCPVCGGGKLALEVR